MKKLLCLLALTASCFGTTTVTGHISTLGTGSVTSGALVRFYLRGCGRNQPRITGTGAIAPQVSRDNVFYFDIPGDGSGNVSGTIYSTRDAAGTGDGQIECGGSYTAVWYGMVVINSGVVGPEVPITAKSGATIDISNVTPNSTQPVSVAPTGDTTYLQLTGGNGPVTGNVDFKSFNQIRNASLYGSIDAAFTACSTCTVLAPAGMTSGNPASSFSSGVLWDMRANTTPSSSVLGNTISYNVTTGGGTKSFVRNDMVINSIPASGSVVSHYNLTNGYNLSMGTGVSLIGGASEANLFGTLTGTLPNILAREDAVTVASDGGTITTAAGQIGYVDISGTSAVTNVIGGWFRGCNTISGTTPTNCYGIRVEDQDTKASGRNFALFAVGRNLIGYSSATGIAGISFEDHSNNVPSVANIYVDSTDTLQIAARNATGLLLQDNTGTNQVKVSSNGFLVFNAITPNTAAGVSVGSTALPFHNLTLGTAATNNFTVTPAATAAHRIVNINDPLSDTYLGLSLNSSNPLYQSKRGVAGCTTGAVAGNNCAADITVTWGTAFPDANYSVTCTGMTPTNVPSAPYVVSKAAGNIHVNYFAITAAAASFATVDCVAVHD